MIAAIVPAAGSSRRMGEPKLLLPIHGVSMIARVVRALKEGGADRVVVVAPPETIAGAALIAAEAAAQAAHVIVPPEQPTDMRASVEVGLAWLQAQSEPPSAVLLTPADSPGLSAATVALVIERGLREPDAIIVPAFETRRGHPVLIPWKLAREIPRLPTGKGINALLTAHADRVREIPITDPSITADLDTPEDYQRWGRSDCP
ncbi:MAG TPA: nucleotidyltransferase family protein [Isosphaeraceae bacterium]|jgi:molybdenum cofactor cytidylyltransferase|nr:nucleotidyltransferase family protein [Isosphaeraceae bacterium]